MKESEKRKGEWWIIAKKERMESERERKSYRNRKVLFISFWILVLLHVRIIYLYSSHSTYALFTHTRPTPRTHYLPILVPLHVRIIYLHSSHSTYALFTYTRPTPRTLIYLYSSHSMYALFTWGWDNFSASLTQPFLMQSQNSISKIKTKVIISLGFKIINSQNNRVLGLKRFNKDF